MTYHAKTVRDVLSVVEDRRFGRSDLAALLTDLDAREVREGVTVYSAPGKFEEVFQDANGPALEWLSAIGPSVESSETGAAMFWSDAVALAVLPPFPLEGGRVIEGWDTSHLRSLLAREFTIGVVLLRLGRFSIGVFQCDTLVSSKTDARYVKGRHSAGGTSQKRFQRVREKQVHELFKKTCAVVERQFTPFKGRLDYILLGGEKFTLRGFRKECDFLRKLSPRILGRVLNVREPKRAALDGVMEAIWESRVLRFE